MDLRNEGGIARIVVVDVFLSVAQSCRKSEWLHTVLVYRFRLERPCLTQGVVSERGLVRCKLIGVVGMSKCSCGIGDNALILPNIGLQIEVEQRTDSLLFIVGSFCRMSSIGICHICRFAVARIVGNRR